MATSLDRQRRRRHGEANYRICRYADDFVVMVSGTKAHAEGLRDEVAAVLAPMGLRLSEAKDDDRPHRRGVRVSRLPHPAATQKRIEQGFRLHLAVEEGAHLHHGQSEDDHQTGNEQPPL